MTVRRLLMVGWDGADPDRLAALMDRGRLPVLADMRRRGVFGRLESTVPPSSLPAWTSALTGLGPGRHGLVDFVRRAPGAYRLELVGSADREASLLPWIAGQAGLRAACLGVPGTFPAEPLPGAVISGFDSPAAQQAGGRAFFPRSLGERLRRRGIVWPYGGLDELAVGPGWHRRARRRLLVNIEQKTRAAELLLREEADFDLFVLVYSESDTAAHHFWAFADPGSPRHRPEPRLADTLDAVYEALDRALGRLLLQLEPDGTALALSDHGAGGASDTLVHLNRFLARQGWLRFAPRPIAARAARAFRDAAARWLPAGLKQAALRFEPLARLALRTDGLARFGDLDLPASRAFCDGLPQSPGIWIHLRGRDPLGCVAPEDYEALRERIAAALLDLRDPASGLPAVARVRRREDALEGRFAGRAPDLLVELAAWDGYRLLAASAPGPGPEIERLGPERRIGSKGLGTSGVHRRFGFLAAAGPGVQAGDPGAARIEDVMPSACAMLGLCVPAGLDGRALSSLAPDARIGQSIQGAGAGSVFSADEEAAIRKRLEGLGYL
ncbi:MAG: alkaline phosphatase family protein [Deltaproteobacteria bacterium]|nr:alkaline phosphatase family protein [Deltaproteobacteria bacterium]